MEAKFSSEGLVNFRKQQDTQSLKVKPFIVTAVRA
jgi:hypothetical protein